MHSFRSIFAGLALTVAFTSGCGLPHEKAYESINASKVGTLTGDVGLRPGVAAPNAQLLDTKGSPVTLSDARANRPTALVFYRGGWCPSCNYQLHELATSSAEFRRRGVALVAVSVDKPDHAVETAKEYGLDFAVLSDPELEAHRAYRVIDHLGGVTTFMIARMGADLEERSGKKHHDVAVPAIFLIDASGTIRWSHADPDYSKRPSAAQILEAIDRSGVAKAAPATAAAPAEPAEPVAAEPTVLR